MASRCKLRARFTLLTLLAFVTVAATVMGWIRANYILPTLREEHATQQLRALGANLHYATPALVRRPPSELELHFPELRVRRYMVNPAGKPSPKGPAWLRKLLGDRYFAPRITGINCSSAHRDLTDDDVKALRHLEALEIFNPYRYETTRLANGTIHSVPRGGICLTDASCDHLSTIPSLQHVSLNESQVTDRGVERLVANLPRLKSLGVSHTKVTDLSLEKLAKVKSLESLRIYQTGVTPDGVRRFIQARPDVYVSERSSLLQEEPLNSLPKREK